MKSKYRSKTSFQHSLPQSSSDWRFLLPITKNSRVLIIGGEQDDFTELFNKIGVSSVTWLCNPSAVASELNENNQNYFDIVAIPFGFPAAKLTDEIEVFRTVRRLLHPGGSIFLGFSNKLGLFSKAFIANSYHSTPHHVIRYLRLSGYSDIDLYGVMSNLETPEYIFPLKADLLGFTLRHRYHYLLPARLLHYFSSRPLVSIVLYLLSYYFVIAKSNHTPETSL